MNPGMIFDKAPFPSCHASTLTETTAGRFVAAWFGGTAEKAKDVQIWLSRFDGQRWSEPVVVGRDTGVPTWNPVLFAWTETRLSLWYKSGPDPMTWTGFRRDSADGGATWSEPRMLPAGFFGPVRAKPIRSEKGTFLAPTSVESHRNWTAFVDRSTDEGVTWLRSNPLVGSTGYHQIQPALAQGQRGLIAVMRSRNPRWVLRSVSLDDGATFSPAQPTAVPNPSAGVDIVSDEDRTLWMTHNPSPIFRTPLVIAKSTDDGQTWTTTHNLETEPGEYSYPALILTHDQQLAYTYTWRRTHIKFGIVPRKRG